MATAEVKTEQKLGCVRVTRLEITGLDKDAKQRWKLLSEMCQQVENTLWQEWLVWHINNGSRDILEQWLAECREWHDADRATRSKKKPKLELKPMTSGISKKLWSIISGRFPQMNKRPLTLIMNAWQGNLTSRKAAQGSLSVWIQILMNRESIPSFTKPLPVPFDSKHCQIIPPEKRGENFKLEIRLWRIPTDKKMSPSITDTVELWTKGRKRNSQAQILMRCLSEEYKFSGSKIVFDRGKVYAMIAYQMPIRKNLLDTEKTAFVRACRHKPLKMRAGWNSSPGGSGRAIESVRGQIVFQRRSRQESYRVAGSSNKGHGRKRAIQGVTKLSHRWKDFVKSWNHQVSREIVNRCIQNGFGKLVWFKPKEKTRDRLFLSWAGKRDDKRESSSWDYFQLQTFLANKCKAEGIDFVAV